MDDEIISDFVNEYVREVKTILEDPIALIERAFLGILYLSGFRAFRKATYYKIPQDLEIPNILYAELPFEKIIRLAREYLDRNKIKYTIGWRIDTFECGEPITIVEVKVYGMNYKDVLKLWEDTSKYIKVRGGWTEDTLDIVLSFDVGGEDED